MPSSCSALCRYVSPLGGITLGSDSDRLTGLWFDGQTHYASTLPNGCMENPSLPVFIQTIRWLDIYFAGNSPCFTPPIHLENTPFRLAVWRILQSIPYGTVVTYGNIASIIARQQGITHMSAQAVGNAVSHNPISIIIPCHRVIGTNGSLTGYTGGIARKQALLSIENTNIPCLRIP